MSKSPARPLPPEPPTPYYVTRDRCADGAMSPMLDVWTSRPDLKLGRPGDARGWLGARDHDVTGVSTRFCTWSLAEGQRMIGAGVPATELECVVVGMATP